MKQNNKRALILVDWQNDYFPKGKFALENVEAAAKNASRLLDAARASDTTVIHIQHVNEQPDAPFFVMGTTGVAVHAGLSPRKGEPVIVKHFPNSFQRTGLLDVLREKKIEELIVSGAMSHMCIDAIVRAATDFGFRCIVAHDACATRDLTFSNVKVPAAMVHAAFMASISFGYGSVLTTADIVSDG